MTQWISFKERLPEKPGYYLVCFRNKRTARRIREMGLLEITYQKKYITHWMSLPTAPEK